MKRREFVSALGTSVLGGALGWPVTARAQQSLPVIGFLSGRAQAESQHVVAAFREGLGEAGFIEGRNVTIQFRWANGRLEQLPAFAAELVRLPVAAIAASGAIESAHAAKAATASIPVVFVTAEDPVNAAIVPSLNRPGGNVTGLTFMAAILGAKQLDLLRMLLPTAQTIAVLVRPGSRISDEQLAQLREAARALDRRIVAIPVSTAEQIDTALAAAVAARAGALVIVAEPFFGEQFGRIAAVASRHAMPAMHNLREFTVAGGLMSYGSRITDAYRQLGTYTGRVLKGEKPADLPVLQPTKYEFILNLKTAKALGLTIPPTLLALADEVIE